MADDLGYNDVGYHDSSIRTPNIDNISAEGVRLEQHYMLASCGPSRASFLTGRYQTGHGMYTNIRKPEPRGLRLDVDTLPQKLKEGGYATHLVGKWHQGYYKEKYLPTNRGFDNFVGIVLGMADHYLYTACMKHNKKQLCGNSAYINNSATDGFHGKYSTDFFGETARDIIKTHGESKNEQPLFLFLSFTAPHIPLQAPESVIDTYRFISDVDRRTYLAMVTEIDKWVGVIQNELETQGMWENSIVVFSSDNGGKEDEAGNNWPLRGGKGSLYEGGIRTAAFVASPLIPLRHRGRVSRDLIHVTDWYPTFLSLAGVPYDAEIDGTNMWSSISQSHPAPERVVLLGMYSNERKPEEITENCEFDKSIKASIRVGQWKLVTGKFRMSTRVPPPGSIEKDITPPQPTDGIRLYNVSGDPYETTNMADRFPLKVQRMCRKLERYRRRSVRFVTADNDQRARPRKKNGYTWGPWLR